MPGREVEKDAVCTLHVRHLHRIWYYQRIQIRSVKNTPRALTKLPETQTGTKALSPLIQPRKSPPVADDCPETQRSLRETDESPTSEVASVKGDEEAKLRCTPRKQGVRRNHKIHSKDFVQEMAAGFKSRKQKVSGTCFISLFATLVGTNCSTIF